MEREFTGTKMRKTIRKIVAAAFAVVIGAGVFCGCAGTEGGGEEPPETPESYKQIFYRPEVGVLADVIPYYEDGEFRLYYLRDYRDTTNYGVGVDWDLITTRKFLSYADEGTMIRRGNVYEQDNCVFTGSIVKAADGVYHIFYTGNNGAFAGSSTPKEAIMHATSPDGKWWTKVPEDTFYAKEGYLRDDWRDPFVYYDESEGNYVMLLAARSSFSQKGETARLVSNDLKKWTLTAPLYAPNNYHTMECPDLFKMGDWWYLVFSEFSDRICTRYVMSRDLKEWTAPASDMFDGRGYYAAKSVTDGDKRYLCGWIPTKKDDRDTGGWEWGGSLAVHEIYQRADGTLATKIPDTIDAAFTNEYYAADDVAVRGSTGKFEKLTAVPTKAYKFECEIAVADAPVKVGVALGHDPAARSNYRYVLDFKQKRAAFENYPAANAYGDTVVPYGLTDNASYKLKIIVEGGVCTMYLDGEIALSSRMNTIPGADAELALYCEGGEATVKDLTVRTV